MPTFETYAKSQTTKLLYLGHSGAGKTGSLAALAAAGYNLRLIDLDKGSEILHDYLLNPASPYRKAHPPLWTQEQADTIISRLLYTQIDETITTRGSNLIVKGDAWQKIMAQLSNWQPESLGNISTWTPQDILVIDGLSRLSTAAENFIRVMNGEAMFNPGQTKRGDLGQSLYHKSQSLILQVLEMLYSSAVPCNVIMICHIAYQEAREIAGPLATTQGFPQSSGKAISPKIAQFFNHALLARKTGTGSAERRVIRCATSEMIDLKSAAPLRVKAEYPLETGLAEYFADLRQEDLKP